MNRGAFLDELHKIGVDLTGLSPETQINYPERQQIDTPGTQRARAILDIYEKIKASHQKTASVGSPDELPEHTRLFRIRRKHEKQTKTDKMLSYGGHALAGAGAAKFLHGGVESAVQMTRKGEKRFWKLDPKWQVGAMTTGAALGLARKVQKDRRAKKTKTAAGVFTFPRSGIASKQFLSRSGPAVKTQLGKQLQGFKGQLPSMPRV